MTTTAIWIDDDPRRKEDADNFRDSIGGRRVKVQFLNTRASGFDAELKSISLPDSAPRLAFIDHRLRASHRQSLFTLGTAVAAFLRQKWGDWPIVGVTATPNLTSVSPHYRLIYDDFLSSDELDAPKFQFAFSLVREAAKMRRLRLLSADDLIRNLSAPADEIPRLMSVIPTKVSDSLGKPGSTIVISEWVRNTLMGKPGFLYDRDWITNFVGITPAAFNRKERFFVRARYSGIFAESLPPRWWGASVRELLAHRFANEAEFEPRELGHKLPGVRKRDWSRCHRCQGFFPETMGRTDPLSRDHIIPLHLRCSVADPQDEQMLHFEERRLLLPR